MRFSVIVPVRNGGAPFARCLAALRAAMGPADELIVVDDGSTDGSVNLAARCGALVITTLGRGPAAARNAGAARAAGEWLFFTDADVAVAPPTLEQIAAYFTSEPALDAVIGAYDDEPAATNFVSQYKNLTHHYMHHNGQADAATFWTGCGAIRRDVFHTLSGFDAVRYPRPTIEDIELGYRLVARRGAGRIRLAPEVQVKHLKRWTLSRLLRSDIFDRALPWSRLLTRDPGTPATLNIARRERRSAGLVVAAFAALGVNVLVRDHGRLGHWLRRAALAALGAVLVLNRAYYAFLWRRRGLRFLLSALPLHWAYYLYSTAAFLWIVVFERQATWAFRQARSAFDSHD